MASGYSFAGREWSKAMANRIPDAGKAGGRWVKVWDAPVRLFHWAIVALVCTSYATAKMGRIDWHFLSGYAILTLVLFRIAWGLAGSETARFSHFVRGPRAALGHLREVLGRQAPHEAGHNAAGGLMVALLLGLLLFQAGTGLFSNDGLMEEGPLAHLAEGAWSDRISGWHAFAFNLILAAVALHVAAVLAYAVVLRQDLVRPMVTGWKRLPATIPAPRMAPAARAIGLALAAAGAVWLISRLG